jgi:aminoglycoside phosphotransferase (APT) family kinase protein
MTDETSISLDAVRTAIGNQLTDVSIIDIQSIQHGTNTVYRIGLSNGPRDQLIMKVGAAKPRRVVHEARIMQSIASSTNLPVPDVIETLGEDDTENPLENPYILMEFVPGQTYEIGVTNLPAEAFERACFEAGRNLGMLHRTFTFDGVGPLQPTETGLTAPDAIGKWPDVFGQVVQSLLASLEESRFDNLLPEIREYTDQAVAELRNHAPYEPVFTHMDYRIENLKLRTDDRPVTAAILDWEGAAAAPPAYELAHTEAVLIDRPELTPDRKATLRNRFYEGYTETGPLSAPPAGTPFRHYRLPARLRLMKNIDEEMGGLPKGTYDARARGHIRFVRNLIEDPGECDE